MIAITSRRLIKLASLFLSTLTLTYASVNTPLLKDKKPLHISESLKAWNETHAKVKLLDHQLIPIDYLEKNPDVKGLLINHGLGTGKTYLGIGFAERNPTKDVIILAPHFLKAHWLHQLEQYGVHNKNRYQILAYNDEKAISDLLKQDLSNTIVILDESHRFIEQVRSQISSDDYKTLYLYLQKAYRTLSLTGTPIYQDVLDLAYQINLVARREAVPFNVEHFKKQYSVFNFWRSFWRGHLGESVLASSMAGNALNISIVSSLLPAIPLYLAGWNNLSLHPLRITDFARLVPLISKYTSHYIHCSDSSLYPDTVKTLKGVVYNDAQFNFLYKAYDSQLSHSELSQLLKDSEAGIVKSTHPENILLNSYNIQNILKNQTGYGREIGNLSFVSASKLKELSGRSYKEGDWVTDKAFNHQIIVPEKFKGILTHIKNSAGPIVVYSHYYHNGILLLKQFLDDCGYKDQYDIFHPQLSLKAQKNLVENFNQGKLKVLLLHPDITEGISLNGARELHFLEMPINLARQEQIVGRVIRYRSHMHLPLEERIVSIYTWYNKHFTKESFYQARKNWYKNFPEARYSALFLDPNAMLKSSFPDEKAFATLTNTKQELEQFQGYLKDCAIENFFYYSRNKL